MTDLELADVNAYYGESHVLFDVSMSVNDGEFVTLIGRNGAGKTTTLRSVVGLVETRSGTIEYGGENLRELPPHEISKRGISFVPEERRIFTTLTVEENIRTGYLGHDKTKSREELYENVFEYFPRLDELKHKNAGQLSGGEQQMVATARGLVSEPDLLLIDEPTEGLMPTLVESFKDHLVRINDSGTTILLVEQNVELAFEVSDRVYIIDEGQIKQEGIPEELRHDEEIQSRYLAI